MKKFVQPDFDVLKFNVQETVTTSSNTECACPSDVYWDTPWEKPVIYLYPEQETQVTVKLALTGDFKCTYPAYNDGWRVTAKPDGTLVDQNGRTYYCLFWEGVNQYKYDLSKGFVIKGQDTAAFLEKTLATLGLNEKEANEFIIYWLPRMEQNAYNLIAFQTSDYEKNAKLTVEPAPDSVLRVFMTYKPLTAPVTVETQKLTPFERTGFTVVEWGGTEVR